MAVLVARFSRVDTSRARIDGDRVKSRRILAKMIDLLAFAGFMSLGVRWFDSTWAGLAIGGAYLLLADALGMSAKNWFSLGVIDVSTGRRCSMASSILRNSPWIAGPLFRTALVSFHGTAEGAERTLAYDVTRGVIGMVGLVITVTLWRGLGGDGTGRHWADELAGTKVLSLKPGEAVRPRPAPNVPKKERARTGGDHDAVDFDDADEGVPKRPKAKPNPRPGSPSGRDRDAVDFDDAN